MLSFERWYLLWEIVFLREKSMKRYVNGKALVSVLKNKKDASDKEKDMANMIDHSYDISDEKYLDPIVRYLLGASITK